MRRGREVPAAEGWWFPGWAIPFPAWAVPFGSTPGGAPCVWDAAAVPHLAICGPPAGRMLAARAVACSMVSRGWDVHLASRDGAGFGSLDEWLASSSTGAAQAGAMLRHIAGAASRRVELCAAFGVRRVLGLPEAARPALTAVVVDGLSGPGTPVGGLDAAAWDALAALVRSGAAAGSSLVTCSGPGSGVSGHARLEMGGGGEGSFRIPGLAPSRVDVWRVPGGTGFSRGLARNAGMARRAPLDRLDFSGADLWREEFGAAGA